MKDNSLIFVRGGGTTTQRNSNLELFRIITMLLIVAHHYVVNSGLAGTGNPLHTNPTSYQTVFLYLFGAWGKTGINCFVLISGYFMCTSHITAKKFAKLLLEVEFYKIGIYLIFAITGYTKFSLTGLLKAFLPVTSIAQNFTGCYLVFFLLIPFLNVTVRNMSEKQHLYLIALLGTIYILLGSLLGGNIVMNYITWFVVLYFIASYVRLYHKSVFENTTLWAVLAACSVIISIVCIVSFHFIGIKTKGINAYYLMTDSNKLLAFTTAFCCFMFFKNVEIKQSKFINTVAASSFGVLLIHANSATMHRFLWGDLLGVVKMYHSPFLIVHAISSVLGIYAVCTAIDYLRICFIEKPFFKLWDRHWEKIAQGYCKIENTVLNRLGIDTETK